MGRRRPGGGEEMTAPPALAGTTRSPQTPRPHMGFERDASREVLIQCQRCRTISRAEVNRHGRLLFSGATGMVTDPHRERLAAARSAWAEAENEALVSGIRSTADRLRGEFRRVEAQRSAGPDSVHRGCGGRFRLFDTRRTAS